MSRALIKHIRLSPTKARLIARQVQGMNAELAMASLKFMPNKGAKFIANAISSAVANGGFEANEVQVLSCRVDAASVLKRFQPRARGSASRIRKPNSHILVIVGKAEENAEIQGKKAKISSENSAANLANSSVNSKAKTAAVSKNSKQNSQKGANSAKNSAKAVNSSENSAKNSAAKAQNSAKSVNSKSNSTPKAENSKAEKAENSQKAENSKENSKPKAAKKPETTKED